MEQAKKISENEINLETVYYSKEVSGLPIVVRSNRLSRNQIETELATLNGELSVLQKAVAQDYIDDKIQTVQTQISKWGKMQQSIDGQLNDTVVITND